MRATPCSDRQAYARTFRLIQPQVWPMLLKGGSGVDIDIYEAHHTIVISAEVLLVGEHKLLVGQGHVSDSGPKTRPKPAGRQPPTDVCLTCQYPPSSLSHSSHLNLFITPWSLLRDGTSKTAAGRHHLMTGLVVLLITHSKISAAVCQDGARTTTALCNRVLITSLASSTRLLTFVRMCQIHIHLICGCLLQFTLSTACI